MSLSPPISSSEERIHALEERVRQLEGVQRRFQTLIDHAPDAICRFDRQWRYLDANATLCKVLGRPCEAMIGRSIHDLGFDPERVARLVALIEPVFETGESREFACEWQDLLGHRQWWEIRVVPELNEQGRVECVVVTGRDITRRRQANQALRDRESRLRLLMEQLPAILWTVDRDLRFTSSTGAGLTALGLTHDQVVGISMWDFRHTRNPNEPVVAAHRRALAGESVELDDAWSGHEYRTRVDPWRDETGEIIGCIGLAFDVTDLRRAENELRQLNTSLERRVVERTTELGRAAEALRENEALFRSISEQMPDGLYLAELHDGPPPLKIILANEAATRQVGFTLDELVGRSFLDLCADIDEETMRQVGAVRQGQVIRMEGVQRRKDGSTFPIELTARAIEYAGGRVAIGLCRDISQRIESEKELRLVKSAVEQVTDAVIITDAELTPPGPRIIYVNPAFEHMTGYLAREVVGHTPRLLHGPDTHQPTLDRLRQALEQGKPFHAQMINYRKDGTPFHLDWRLAPIRGGGGAVVNWVAIQRDVTEQKKTAELAAQHQAELAHVARLSTMGEMASGLAHELNQPLAAILNYARGSLRLLDAPEQNHSVHESTPTSPPGPGVRQALERIAAQAERSGQIIQGLRRFIRKRDPQRTSTDLNQLVQEAGELIELKARQKQVRIDFSLTPDLPQVMVDPIQVQQVVLNLLHNGIEAVTENGGERKWIRVTTGRIDLPGRGEGVQIDVSNPGTAGAEGGKDVADLERIFDPFFTTRAQGMGMGLTISRTLIEGHDGRLWATRNEEGGLTFHLRLPVVKRGAAGS